MPRPFGLGAIRRPATEDATKSNVSACRCGSEGCGRERRRPKAAQTKQAAVSTLVRVKEAPERAAATAYAQVRWPAQWLLRCARYCVHFDGTGCIEVPVTRHHAAEQQRSDSSRRPPRYSWRKGHLRSAGCVARALADDRDEQRQRRRVIPRCAIARQHRPGLLHSPAGSRSRRAAKRAWQHIAVSDGSQVSYFIDGELVMRFKRSGELSD